MFRILTLTNDLSKEEWLSFRRKGIGGSDVAAICGINPYESAMEVWLDKTDQLTEDVSDNEAMYWGNVLEPLLMAEFEKRNPNLDIGRENSILQHGTHDFMIANLDGLIYDSNAKESYVFEAKTTSAFNAAVWDNGVPDFYKLQVQHYLAVTNFKGAFVAVLVGGQQYKQFFIERDEELIDMLIQIVSNFWNNHVLTGIPPEVDGSQSTVNLLNKKYPTANEKTIELPLDLMPLIENYDAACEIEAKAVELKNESINRLKYLLEDYEVGIIGDRKITWKNVETERLDSKLLKKEEPELYAKYSKSSISRRFTIK